MSWGTAGTIKIYGSEREMGGESEEMERTGENSLAEEQKAGPNDNMRPWDGNKEDRGLISQLLQPPFLPWPPLSFIVSCLFFVLSHSFFQHPITASACCLSCGVHGWKWLGTSNRGREEKKGREGGERDGAGEIDFYIWKKEWLYYQWWPPKTPCAS